MTAISAGPSPDLPLLSRKKALVVIAGLALFFLVLHVYLIHHLAARPLDHDEAEYLHASWLMSDGLHIYRDFMEDHPPFLYQLLNLLQPARPTLSFPLLDVPLWAVRARWLMGLFGTVTLFSACAIAWRISRSLLAPLFAAAFLLGSDWTWIRGLADIRADEPTLAMFWLGFALLIWSREDGPRRALLSGLGMALVAGAEIWNPKWPLEGLVVGVVYLRVLRSTVRRRRLLEVTFCLLPSVAMAGLALLVLLRATSIDQYLYFNFELKAANMAMFRHNPWIQSFFSQRGAFDFTSFYLRGIWPVIGVILAVWPILGVDRRREWLVRNWRRCLLVLLVSTAFLELRFVYTWPQLWPQYFLMWAVVLSVVYAMGAVELSRIIERSMARWSPPLLPLVVLSGVVSTFLHITTLAAATPDVGGLGPPSTILALMVLLILCWMPFVVVGALAVRSVAPSVVARGFLSLVLIISIVLLGGSGLARRAFAWPIISTSSWQVISRLQTQLNSGETVWLPPTLHPIGVRDASYFWYSFQDLMVMTLSYIEHHPEETMLPRVPGSDLPPCRLARGEDRALRFFGVLPQMLYEPQVCRCVELLLERGGVGATAIPMVMDAKPGVRKSGRTVLPESFGRVRTRSFCGGSTGD